MKKIDILLLLIFVGGLLLVVFGVFLLTCTPPDYYPDEGVWYCAELQMQLDFGGDDESFAIVNGEKIMCGCGADRGSTWLMVGNIDVNCTQFRLGEAVWGGTFVSLDDTKLIIKDDTGVEYTFYRTK